MAEFTSQWPAGSLTNIHSSNPEPLSWEQLQDITNSDVGQILTQSPLGYEPVKGNEKLRHLISHHYHHHIKTDDVVLTSGAQEGIFLVMQALLSSDDHVIAFTPCFEPLVKVAKNTGALVSTCELMAHNNWQIDWQQLKGKFTTKTKLLIINFPHNPTGTHISAGELKKLQELCREYDCWLFSDEVFRGLEHESENRIPPAADDYEKAISMGVMSKALALPGIRLGWLCCKDPALLQEIITIKSHLSICQSSLDGQLCQLIIPHSEAIWQRNTSIILENKTKLREIIRNNDDFTWTEPVASATAFVQLNNNQARFFAQTLAHFHKWLVLPSEVFLTEYQGFRISLGVQQSKTVYQQIFNHRPDE
ncbi:MAG: pyridoxal phosphate-dependent aminotransferase [Marinicella sp.]|nr:pyridoxal phosphate-dependent aminotransferase [Xanthomonadales bacterium]